MDGRDRLYKELGVERGASTEEIKRAYRRMALRCHPDKAGAEGVAQFTRVKAAYDVLSDPSKRAIYDRYGDSGVEMINNPYSEPFVSNLGTTTILLLFALGTFFFFLAVLVTLSFIAAKVDGKVAWSWGVVLTPLWMWDGFVVLVLLAAIGVVVKNWVEDAQERQQVPLSQRLAPLYVVLVVGLMVAHHIAIGAGLDSATPADRSWLALFAPGIAAEALLTVALTPPLSPWKMQEALRRQGLAEVSLAWCAALAACHFVAVAFRLPLYVMIGSKLDGSLAGSSSWHVVGAPIYIFLLSNVASSILSGVLQHRSMPEQAPLGAVACAAAFSVVVNGLVAVTTGLTLAKIEGVDVGLGSAFIALLILISGCTVVAGVGAFVFSMQAAQQLQEMELDAAAAASAERSGSPQQNAAAAPEEPVGGAGASGEASSPPPPHVPQYMDIPLRRSDATAVNITADSAASGLD